ncbi:MAG: hypothetical protein ABII88_05465 [Candidatus Omnitrophota bacterium]
MLKKTILFLLIFSSMFSLNSFAQVNEKLVKSLNDAFILESKSQRQCEFHSNKFNIAMPYHRIILEKQQTIERISDLILAIDGKITDKMLGIERAKYTFPALNNDASVQIQLIQLYDDILSKFGHPDVQTIIKRAKNLAYQHFMLLSNSAQRISYDNKLDLKLNAE